MRANELKIHYEDMDISDKELIERLNETKHKCKERKADYDEACKDFDENNYCSFLMSRLYYEFCKEEYNKLFNEAHKRRLIF